MKRKTILLIFIMLFLSIIFFNTLEDFSRVNAGDVILTDMMDREIVLPGNIERIVTTYKPATQFIFALGAEERLVAVDIGSPGEKLFTNLLPEIKELPVVGSKRNGLNLEEIIVQKPDLVILFPYKEGIETAKNLARHGIASIIIKPESLREIRETNLLLGKALGLEERAERINSFYDQLLDFIKERLRGLDEEDKKRVYFANTHFLDTFGDEVLQTSLIEVAGGINPAKQSKKGFLKISAEQLLEWNPDLIVLSQYYGGDINELSSREEYQFLRAFKEDKIYRVPSNLEPWDFPGPSSFLSIIWLSAKLYPERFKDFDITEIVNNYYYNLYAKSFSNIGGILED
jgi:iron complex transport system substrate-binding protein